MYYRFPDTLMKRHVLAGCLLFVAAMVVMTPHLVAQEASTPVATTEISTEPCQDGRLRIRDLALAEQSLAGGLAEAQNRAELWQPDARLVELRLACPLLKTGLVWEGTFFSETAQAYFATDTADVEPAEEAPEDIPSLAVQDVSFQAVYRSLLRAGFSEDLLLASASSVTVRPSTEQIPFGPPTAPTGIIYVHVAVEERGQIKDVWINGVDGTIYRYETEG